MDSDDEERWRELQESLAIEDSFHPNIAGDLQFPSLKKKEEKKVKKPRTTQIPPKPKLKQGPLTQPLFTDAEIQKKMELFRKFESKEDDVEFEKYLLDDENDSNNDALEDSADEEKLTSLAAELLQANISKGISAEKQCVQHSVQKEEGINHVVSLQDETFLYDTVKGPSKPRKIGGKGYREEVKSSGPEHLSCLLEETENKEKTNIQPTVPASLFYWIDAKEQSYASSIDPGAVFLFGKSFNEKTKKIQSCCIRVRNLERVCFVLPAEGASDSSVIQEINAIFRTNGIERRRMKFVDRFYCFEDKSIPHEKSRWVKVRYPGSYPPLSRNGPWKCIQSVMGTSYSLLELFFLKRRIKGPAFLRIENMAPAVNKISHCAAEYVVESPKFIHVENAAFPTPLFTALSIQLHTQLDANGCENEIIMASLAIYSDLLVDNTFPFIPTKMLTGIQSGTASKTLPVDLESVCRGKKLFVSSFRNERSLLMWLASTIKEVDPDMLVGHNFVGFTLNTLLHRMQELRVSEWSTLGRLDLKRFPRLQSGVTGTYQEREVCCGRLIVDSYSLSREYFKSSNYKLLALSKEMKLSGIIRGNTTFEPGSSRVSEECWVSASQLCDIILQHCNHAILSMSVISYLDIIRLTKRLTAIAGNLWSRTLYGARSERIEYLLLHTFYEIKFILPDKHNFDTAKKQREDGGMEEMEDTKRKAKYQGGMVLEPKCGLYSDYVLLLDFNSLYPTLIQEFNICFTTVERWGNEETEVPPPENLICSSCRAGGLPSPCSHKCVLPKVIKSLVDQRREVKRLMKTERDPNQLSLLEIRQKALKLTANSMYGCLGFEFSRFFAQPLAELVTRQGRLALQSVVEIVPRFNPTLRVIYGDTDSVMIQTGIKNDINGVRQLGLSLKTEINKRYQSLEIDIDGIFRSILLLKKKKYAALSVVDWQGEGKALKEEVKGLDMVRRDWCPLSKKVGDAVLKRVLNAEAGEDVLDYIMKYMGKVAENVRAGDVYGLDDFVISKGLTKEPDSYKGNSFPHAQVALRMRERHELVRVGDIIPYVICCPEEGKNEEKQISERAFHVEEVRKQQVKRSLDPEWYLSSQIYPPVVRLCEHIQGFTPLQLSEVMGIHLHPQHLNDGANDTSAEMDFSHCALFKNRRLTESFPTALALQVCCPHCSGKTAIDPHERVREIVNREGMSIGTSLFELYVCTLCNGELSINYIANSLLLFCHRLLREFYSVGGSTSAVKALRTQLTYFRALFDIPRMPGCSSAILFAHRCRALRCISPDGSKRYTLAACKVDESLPDDSSEKRFIVDPVFLAIESFYNRIEHLFIQVESLF